MYARPAVSLAPCFPRLALLWPLGRRSLPGVMPPRIAVVYERPVNHPDLVTGVFSHCDSHIAKRLLESERELRTLTIHPDRGHPLRSKVEALPYQFEAPVALRAQPRGCHDSLQHLLGRFRLRRAPFANAVANAHSLSTLRAAPAGLAVSTSASPVHRSIHRSDISAERRWSSRRLPRWGCRTRS